MRFTAVPPIVLALTRFAAAKELHSFWRVQLNDPFWSEGPVSAISTTTA